MPKNRMRDAASQTSGDRDTDTDTDTETDTDTDTDTETGGRESAVICQQLPASSHCAG